MDHNQTDGNIKTATTVPFDLEAVRRQLRTIEEQFVARLSDAADRAQHAGLSVLPSNPLSTVFANCSVKSSRGGGYYQLQLHDNHTGSCSCPSWQHGIYRRRWCKHLALAARLQQQINANFAPPLQVDNWVQCDACSKWRKLADGMDPERLPDDWYCSQNTWDVERSNCDAPEEEGADK